MKRNISIALLLTVIGIDIQIGLFRSSDFAYYMGVQVIEILLFILVAYNTLAWVRFLSVLGAVLCTIKGYDIYNKNGTVLQPSDFIVLSVAAVGIFVIYRNHKKKQHDNR